MQDSELKALVTQYQAEQREAEVIWFYRAVEKIKPKIIVEIGIKEGGNLKVLSTHLDEDGVAVGIDPRQEIPWKMDDAKCPVHHIKKNSHLEETVEDLKAILNGREIDVLFIDGDHSKAGMLQDFHDYFPLVRSGGIIAVHDIYYLKDVADAWAEVPGAQRFESERNQSSIGIGYIIKD
jgi:predicted O-methyltransferase YrrM